MHNYYKHILLKIGVSKKLFKWLNKVPFTAKNNAKNTLRKNDKFQIILDWRTSKFDRNSKTFAFTDLRNMKEKYYGNQEL